MLWALGCGVASATLMYPAKSWSWSHCRKEGGMLMAMVMRGSMSVEGHMCANSEEMRGVRGSSVLSFSFVSTWSAFCGGEACFSCGLTREPYFQYLSSHGTTCVNNNVLSSLGFMPACKSSLNSSEYFLFLMIENANMQWCLCYWFRITWCCILGPSGFS